MKICCHRHILSPTDVLGLMMRQARKVLTVSTILVLLVIVVVVVRNVAAVIEMWQHSYNHNHVATFLATVMVSADQQLYNGYCFFLEENLDDLLAQALAFFFAGFETTAATLAFCLYELSSRPHLQLKVQAEVDAALERHGGFTYQMLQDLPYTDKAIDGMLAHSIILCTLLNDWTT